MSIMKKRQLIGLLAFLGSCWMAEPLSAQGFKGCATGKESIVAYNDDFDQEVLRLVNVEREKRKLKPLQWHEGLALAARYHAQDMAMDNYMDHYTYDRNKGGGLKRGCGTFDRIKQFVTDIFPCAENVAAGDTNPEDVVKGWMKSKGHRENILNKQAKYLGCGVYYNEESDYGWYWAQCFGY